MESALASLVGVALLGGPEAQGFLELLPDPMRPTLQEVGFIMLLVTVLYWVLRLMFFQPLTALMAQRDRDMEAGRQTKAEASDLIRTRQEDYQARLRDLRAQAFARKKALSEAVAKEKAVLLEEARTKALGQRADASQRLAVQRDRAKADLVAQVDALAESMVSHLLKGA